MTLARERAISTAYLVSGDYDIREGVVAAQDMGVQVYLFGFETGNPSVAGVAPPLIQEVDGFEKLGRDFLSPYFADASAPAAAEEEDKAPEEVGMGFALRWAEDAGLEEIDHLLEQAPRIPVQIDAQLLRRAEDTFGSLRGRQTIRMALRSGFWDGVRQARANYS